MEKMLQRLANQDAMLESEIQAKDLTIPIVSTTSLAVENNKDDNIVAQKNFFENNSAKFNIFISVFALLGSIFSIIHSVNYSGKVERRIVEDKLQEVLDLLGHETTLMISRLEKDPVKLDKAFRILEHLEVENPRNPDVYLRFGLYHQIREQPNKALELYNKAFKLDPQNPEVYNHRGYLFLTQKDPRALEEFQKALDISPLYAKALINRAVFYVDIENYDAALKDCEAVRSNQPLNPLPRKIKGDIYYKQLKYEKAIHEYSWAIKYYSLYYDAHFNRGQVYLLENRVEEAVDDFKVASEIDEGEANAFFYLGLGMNLLGDSEGALKNFEIATKLDPGFTMAHYRYAQALIVLEKYHQAESKLALVTSLDPRFAEAWVDRARVSIWLTRNDKALEFALNAKNINPKMARAHFTLGHVYICLNDPRRANESFDEAIQLDPSLKPAIQNVKSKYH